MQASRSKQPRVRRRRLGADAARGTILDAAAKVFARKGFYGATIDDIARESGYSPAAVYKYFQTKEALFITLWGSMSERLGAVVDECMRLETTFLRRLRYFINCMCTLLEENPDLFVAFIAQRPYLARQLRSDLEKRASAYYRENLKQLVALMQRGIDEKALRPGDPQDYTRVLIGMLYEFAHQWLTSGRVNEARQHLDTYAELFLHGVAAPPSPGG